MKLTQEEKDRLAVCRDVLKWITPTKVKTSNGYVVSRSKTPTEKLLGGKDSKKIAKGLQKTCQVCAKGAMFLSLVGLKNKYDFKPESEHHGMSDHYYDYCIGVDVDYDRLMVRLKEVFEEEQLHMVETAFEVVYGDNPKNYGWEDNAGRQAAVQFGIKYKSPITRLKAIMNNMIENNGKFKP